MRSHVKNRLSNESVTSVHFRVQEFSFCFRDFSREFGWVETVCILKETFYFVPPPRTPQGRQGLKRVDLPTTRVRQRVKTPTKPHPCPMSARGGAGYGLHYLNYKINSYFKPETEP